MFGPIHTCFLDTPKMHEKLTVRELSVVKHLGQQGRLDLTPARFCRLQATLEGGLYNQASRRAAYVHCAKGL